MAIMFHFMMAWLFIYRRQSRVRILLCTLMTLIVSITSRISFFLAIPRMLKVSIRFTVRL